MSEEGETFGHIYYFPPEILQNIFIYLSAKDLVVCRAVHPRWKAVVDDLSTNENLWERNCKDDFNKTYMIARNKARPGVRWYNLYRSLTLWRVLGSAKVEIEDLATASRSCQEIRNFVILKNGLVGVLKKGAIVYYDVETMSVAHREPLTGDYTKYLENDYVIIIQNYNLHLFIIRKKIMHSYGEERSITFDNVKLFTLSGHELYFVNLRDEIFVCNLGIRQLSADYLAECRDDRVISMGCKGGFVNILTFQRQVYTIARDKFLMKSYLGPDENLLHQFLQLNFLENLNWRVYFQWMHLYNHSIPEGPLRDIIIIRPYGDIFFVGSNWGVLHIYYSPYKEGEFNIFQTRPIKQYNFMDNCNKPVLCMCPILQVDVMEGLDGHTVMVAMPKKVVVLTYTHNFNFDIAEIRELDAEVPVSPSSSGTPALPSSSGDPALPSISGVQIIPSGSEIPELLSSSGDPASQSTSEVPVLPSSTEVLALPSRSGISVLPFNSGDPALPLDAQDGAIASGSKM